MKTNKHLIFNHVKKGFPCLNCDSVIPVSNKANLYCSNQCRDTASLVRYIRSCQREEGKLKDPEVLYAIQIRFAHLFSGTYNRKERYIPQKTREAVIKRDNGLCVKCGSTGDEIDHISGSSCEMENLQLLCNKCHIIKTKKNLVEMTPNHERFEEFNNFKNAIRKRVEASPPKRICDDDLTWKETWRNIFNDRQKFIKTQILFEPEREMFVLFVVSMVHLGMNNREIADQLNTLNIPTLSNKGEWTSKKLRGFLRNQGIKKLINENEVFWKAV